MKERRKIRNNIYRIKKEINKIDEIKCKNTKNN